MTAAMPQRLLVVGGVAAGLTAASRAKRQRPDLEVIVFERGPWVSYGACGMPFNLADPARHLEDLVVFTPERMQRERGIEVRVNHTVTSLDLPRRILRVRRPDGESEFGFDRLILATGARAIPPPWPGADLPGVFTLRTLEHGRSLKRFLSDPTLRRAVVVGGGHVGLQLADALCARGLAVTMLLRSGTMPPGFSDEIGAILRAELIRYGVEVREGINVVGFSGDVRVRQVQTDQGRLPADVVAVAIGVAPETTLAREAGLRIGESGAIAVDDRMETSAQGVFAAGDCAEAHHLLLNRGLFLPRGTTANKQGRIAGHNAAGGDERFRGVVGTSLTKVFSLAVGHCGLFDDQARAAGFDPASETVRARSRGHAYPGGKDITVRLLFGRRSGRLLGSQMVGEEGVAKRLDVIVAALTAGWTVEDLAALDLSYSPPYAPVWDPVLVAANQARKGLSR